MNNPEEKKPPQLSWSQPLSTPAQKPPSVLKDAPSPSPISGTAEQSPKQKSTLVRNVAIALIVLVAAGSSWLLWGRDRTDVLNVATVPNSNTNGSLSGTVASGTASMDNGSLSVPSPQAAGMEVIVSNVVVEEPTWIVVYESRGGEPGNILGAALFTKTRRSGSVDLLRATLAGQGYFVSEARDDGDRMYSVARDTPVRDAEGNQLWMRFETR